MYKKTEVSESIHWKIPPLNIHHVFLKWEMQKIRNVSLSRIVIEWRRNNNFLYLFLKERQLIDNVLLNWVKARNIFW